VIKKVLKIITELELFLEKIKILKKNNLLFFEKMGILIIEKF
jgi:hypothetical protein